MTLIRQVATILGYGEPQILDVFKNTLPTRLYWVLFPIEDLRQAVETVKRILTKEKIDRQIAGQSSSTPFMSTKDNQNNKGVTFDMQGGLQEKIDRQTVMMSKLTPNDDGTNIQFKPKIFQSKKKMTDKNFFMTNIITIREIIRIGTDQVVEIEEFHLVVEFSKDKITEVDQGINKAIGMSLKREETIIGNMGVYQNQNFRKQNNRGGYRGNYRNVGLELRFKYNIFRKSRYN